MKALCWHGKHNVSLDTVPDPQILTPGDIILKVSSTAICGTDLHVYNNLVPEMHKGDILGHEFMGEVVETGADVRKLKTGDRVVIPAVIACGECVFCKQKLFSLCEYSNPNAEKAKQKMSQASAAVFGYSHLNGGYAGGQAEYVRVPFADVGAIKVESNIKDEKVLFVSDILPTGYMAAENCSIEKGETVAVWGCGPVGQMAIQSAWLLGAGRVIAIDQIPERLALARKYGKAETINFSEDNVFDKIMVMTKGMGVEKCIEAVGTEAHPCHSFEGFKETLKQATLLSDDRVHALKEAIKCCKKGGTVSVPGVYLGIVDGFPMGEVMNKNLTIKSGNTHMQKYLRLLLDNIENGNIDPSFIITHRMALRDAPKAYEIFNKKKKNCIKVVMKA